MSRRAAKIKRPVNRRYEHLQSRNIPAPRFWERLSSWRPVMTVEALVIGICLYVVAVSNTSFWHAASRSGHVDGFADVFVAITVLISLTASYAIPLCLLLPRVIAKPVLGTVLLLAAAVSFAAHQYVECIDAALILKIIASPVRSFDQINLTDVFLWLLLPLMPPAILLWRVRIKIARWPIAAVHRFLAALLVTTVLGMFVALAPRNALLHLSVSHDSLRAFVVPNNAVAAIFGLWDQDEAIPGDGICKAALEHTPDSKTEDAKAAVEPPATTYP